MTRSLRLIRPDPARWRDLPLDVSPALQALVAGLITGATVGGLLLIERLLPDEGGGPAVEYFVGGFLIGPPWASYVFVGLFWVGLGRHASIATPPVLAALAVPYGIDGSGGAYVAAAGAVLSLAWAAVCLRRSVRGTLAAASLARDTPDGGIVPEVGAGVDSYVLRTARKGVLLAVGTTAAAIILFLIADFEVVSDPDPMYQRLFPRLDFRGHHPGAGAVFAVLFTALAFGYWARVAGRSAARLMVGLAVWEVPLREGPLRLPAEAAHDADTGFVAYYLGPASTGLAVTRSGRGFTEVGTEAPPAISVHAHPDAAGPRGPGSP
ncbi:hypothetical protein ACQ7DA_14335 [Zafaria sp. J156]|uniref:hypothetical protein n=1 Tax=Zafaria sp. J156 TaxID=3116490 RepID=UPI002E77AD0F|nr:hypothetical protein [Zafaria sp. J156]MEE1622400.1 hypothetical protein [Zafaria sp. J156]